MQFGFIHGEVHSLRRSYQIEKYICPNAKCICTNLQVYLSKCKMYLYKLKSVFVKGCTVQYPHHLIIFGFRSKNKYCLSAGSYLHLQIFHLTLKTLHQYLIKTIFHHHSPCSLQGIYQCGIKCKVCSQSKYAIFCS